MIDIREKKYTVYNLYEMFMDGRLMFPFKPTALHSLQKKAQEGHLSLQKEYRDTSSQEEQA